MTAVIHNSDTWILPADTCWSCDTPVSMRADSSGVILT